VRQADCQSRGFAAAYHQDTGKEAWRFWTVPAAGEPGSEPWQGKGIEQPSADAWFTGTYDPQLDLVYWPTSPTCLTASNTLPLAPGRIFWRSAWRSRVRMPCRGTQLSFSAKLARAGEATTPLWSWL